MSVPIQPLADYVVAQTEEAATKTASGLYLPGGAQEKPKVAKVLAAGKDVKAVKVGDKIIYKNEYDATNLKVGSEEFAVVERKNIIAIAK